MTFEDYFAERLAKLRQNKGVSARDMSLSLGQNANYINSIENKKMFPSMLVFFYICEYLEITPKDFFDDNNVNPKLINDLIEDLRNVNFKILPHISGLIKEIIDKKQ